MLKRTHIKLPKSTWASIIATCALQLLCIIFTASSFHKHDPVIKLNLTNVNVSQLFSPGLSKIPTPTDGLSISDTSLRETYTVGLRGYCSLSYNPELTSYCVSASPYNFSLAQIFLNDNGLGLTSLSDVYLPTKLLSQAMLSSFSATGYNFLRLMYFFSALSLLSTVTSALMAQCAQFFIMKVTLTFTVVMQFLVSVAGILAHLWISSGVVKPIVEAYASEYAEIGIEVYKESAWMVSSILTAFMIVLMNFLIMRNFVGFNQNVRVLGVDNYGPVEDTEAMLGDKASGQGYDIGEIYVSRELAGCNSQGAQ